MLKRFFCLTALGLVLLTSTVFAQTTPTVQFVGRHLQVNGQPFFIRGVNDSLFPINTFPTGNGICYWDPTSATSFTCPWFNAPNPPSVYDFDFVVNYELQLTSQLLANTYRTFSKVTV